MAPNLEQEAANGTEQAQDPMADVMARLDEITSRLDAIEAKVGTEETEQPEAEAGEAGPLPGVRKTRPKGGMMRAIGL